MPLRAGTLTVAVRISGRADGSRGPGCVFPWGFPGGMVERTARRGYGDALYDVRERTR